MFCYSNIVSTRPLKKVLPLTLPDNYHF
uniref:Uncharacterized protein n=1 Tax=Anguilla anguilla TaxID=7936 RepID=A0A0E9VCI4_ANGAN